MPAWYVQAAIAFVLAGLVSAAPVAINGGPQNWWIILWTFLAGGASGAGLYTTGKWQDSPRDK